MASKEEKERTVKDYVDLLEDKYKGGKGDVNVYSNFI